MFARHHLVVFLLVYAGDQVFGKTNLTFDEFFDYTSFSSLTLAPDNGQAILIQTKHRIWDHNVSEEHLHLYNLQDQSRTLITTQASSSPPRWKGDFIALLLASDARKKQQQQFIHLYAVRTGQLVALPTGDEPIHAYTWSTTSMSIYFATPSSRSSAMQTAYENEWRGAIEYREQHLGDTIYRVDIENMTVVKIEPLLSVPLRIDEMICSPDGRQVVYMTTSGSLNTEYTADHELYSIDLTDPTPIVGRRLTNNSAIESNLKWSPNGMIFFTVTGAGSIEGDYEESQGRIYSLNPATGRVERWAHQFDGEITSYALLNGGQSVLFLGQRSTTIQVYQQSSVGGTIVSLLGLEGTYESLASSSNGDKSIVAFIHSSYETPQEVYVVDDFNRLTTARQVTHENHLFTERNLPQGKSYRWTNADDHMEIEGILLYPPNQFEAKNLPLYVLIHGGPDDADVNSFRPDWYYTAAMMANEGWLVFQPNYRGSTGYGDAFLRGVRFQIVSRPAKDILYGVDALIRDGLVDPKRLTIGGYSYGGYLTNWIITQTTRFNAAVSGAGACEHVADWGLTDIPLTNVYMLGGYPWEVPRFYQDEAAIFHMHKARTPTLIIAPGADIRVATSENYILERALHSLRVPVKLIVFPDESHIIGDNPWYEKIKVREELKWLRKYGQVYIPPDQSSAGTAVFHGKTLIQLLALTLYKVFVS